MKRIITLLLCLAVISTVLTACSKGQGGSNTDVEKLKPTETVDAGKLQPDEDYTGDYANDEYTAHIEKDENGEMTVLIRSKAEDGAFYEWTMSGYFSEEHSRINYDNAVKYLVSLNNKGREKNRSAEYENGAGRISFTDTGHFVWNDSMEAGKENTEFERK